MLVQDLFENRTNDAYKVFQQLAVAVNRSQDIDLKIGREMMPIAYWQARHLLGQYKSIVKNQGPDAGMTFLSDYNTISAALDAMDAKLASYKNIGSVPGQRGVAENEEQNPVAGAITRRILTQRTDLLSKYGPVLVTQAIDDVADFVGDTEEIGSSDVSGWVQQVERALARMGQDLGEAGRNYHANRTGFARGARDPEGQDPAPDTRTWYIRLNGKLIRDKQGNPYSFRDKAAANKAALTMQAKLFNQGKEFVLTTNPNDPQQGMDEGWKETLGTAALTGAMALGSAGAQARVTPDGQGGFTGGLKPSATVTAPADNKPAAETPKGFSKEYLQKAADPNRTGRYMISVERAQELLKGMQEGMAEGEKDTSRMNKQSQDFYNKNPNFKRDDRETKSLGNNRLATRVDPTGGLPKVAKKAMTPFRSMAQEDARPGPLEQTTKHTQKKTVDQLNHLQALNGLDETVSLMRAANRRVTENLNLINGIQDVTQDLDSQFDIIEDWIGALAKQLSVDPEQIWEDFESVDDETLLETAAWQKKSGKNKTGGLNAKGVASYRREHPGSKLQTAVTTKPSKLKPGSKAAKRRKSFCARMSGVKGPMKKPNGKPTRKALALRKWNCHESVMEAANAAQQAAIAIAMKKAGKKPKGMSEDWSQKYKSSINCSHPKGFSQKAHCAGKKKHTESVEMEMTCPDCGMCETHVDHTNLDEACWKGYHKEGNKKMFGKTYPNCVKNEDIEEDNSRIARKPGQPANSKKHSDLYTDENPKGTITGLKFATAEDARASVSKIRNSGRSHAHKIQAAVAMEQRAKAAGKSEAASVYRKYINATKKTDEGIDLEEACWDTHKQVGMKNKGGKQVPNCVPKESVQEQQSHSESCPHCGGEMVSEELMNEKKDACYYKVKSRYKVWPSAYASGALVKCRKKGASNWGNKTTESLVQELEENLHDWFNKEKWVRMDTKGNIKGDCAREPGEGKPKCLPAAKAHALGKKGRASAAQRKRRQDPNPERSGKAINVATKEDVSEQGSADWPFEALNELSNEKLTQYKRAAAADAGKSDLEGNFKRADKRFGGIVQATKKQFANDVKKYQPQ